MSLVIMGGASRGLRNLLNAKVATLNTWYVGLFTGNTTPAAGDSNATYNGAEPSLGQIPGYARQPLVFPGGSATDSAGTGSISAALVTFTPASVGTGVAVYGYFVSDSPTAGAGNVQLAERNPSAPVTVGASLVPYFVQPVLQEQSVP